jgi:hypothetical protein
MISKDEFLGCLRIPSGPTGPLRRRYSRRARVGHRGGDARQEPPVDGAVARWLAIATRPPARYRRPGPREGGVHQGVVATEPMERGAWAAEWAPGAGRRRGGADLPAQRNISTSDRSCHQKGFVCEQAYEGNLYEMEGCVSAISQI